MASEELFKVERILDKRKSNKGKMEYLVQWKGYNSQDDTWELEQHLVNFEECIHDFNRCHSEKQDGGTFSRANRTSVNNGQKRISRSTNSSFSKAAPKALVVGKEQEAKSSLLVTTSQKFRKSPTTGLATRKNTDLAQSDISILVPKSPIKGSTAVDGFQDNSSKRLDPLEQGPEDTADTEAAAQKPGDGPVMAATATGLAVNGKGTYPFMDALMAYGTTSLQTTVTAVTSGKKFIENRREQPLTSCLASTCGRRRVPPGSGISRSRSRTASPSSCCPPSHLKTTREPGGARLLQTRFLEESKSLVHYNMRLELEQAKEQECEVLKKIWSSAQEADLQVQQSSFSKATPKALVVSKEWEVKSSLLVTANQKFRKKSTHKNMDLAQSDIKILLPKSPMKGSTLVDHFQDDNPKNPGPMEKGPEDTGDTEAVAEKPGVGPISVATTTGLAMNGKVTSSFMDALMANRMTSLQTSFTGVMARKSKFIEDRRDEPFDKLLHLHVWQTESTSRYQDIMVQKQDGFTHILLSTKLSKNNLLNPEVMKELQSALSTAGANCSRLVLLSTVGSVFCCSLDFVYFIQHLTDDHKREGARMADVIRSFVNTFIWFTKPIIIAVNGPAIGLGTSILALCDQVWAKEKTWLKTPYTTFRQSPDGCSTVMFPKIMGGASDNEMLVCGRKLMAQEVCGKGLVSRVFWPRNFTQDVMDRIKELASCNPVVLEEPKSLVCCNMRLELEQANKRE
ncbi:unnamed protein product [Rangifer tarandus platyrhynchus]|uniref:Chromo domain-containing protein n=1 Tax=Rangifer tarandus platyrhynchus TaxID=3082113 RepID=A0ABN9A7A2_RANTA|nr:unnamed protein product [Rangifer tarandus platyrhynchus]